MSRAGWKSLVQDRIMPQRAVAREDLDADVMLRFALTRAVEIVGGLSQIRTLEAVLIKSGGA